MKLDDENNSIVLTLFNVNINVEIENVGLTLVNVVIFNNVETTMKGSLGFIECC